MIWSNLQTVHCKDTDGFKKKKKTVFFHLILTDRLWFLHYANDIRGLEGKNSLKWLIAFLWFKKWDRKWRQDGRWEDARRKIIAHFPAIPEKINVTHLQRLCHIFYTKDSNRVCLQIYFWTHTLETSEVSDFTTFHRNCKKYCFTKTNRCLSEVLLHYSQSCHLHTT